jgi:predicted transposase YbfD/YdcC
MEVILAILREVRDPRDFNARHDLGAILFVSLAATLCGAKSCVDIADFADANFEVLNEIAPMRHGAPSHDCFSRVFRLLDPEDLAQALSRICAALRKALGLGAPKGVVAVDGKSLRRAYERGRSFAPPLMVSVWDAETRLSIASRSAEGGDEVGATLEALKALSLKGCTVTADALHCHPRMAQAVRDAKAHYALGLKGNHGPLHQAAVSAFAQAEAGGGLLIHETRDQGHGRQESRRASVIASPASAPAFPGLAALGRIQAERTDERGRTSLDTRYVALSRKFSPERLNEVVRAHWSVENHLHWTLDVVFHEDDARSRKDNAAQNLAVIRRIALDILNAHPDKRSASRKMKLASWRQDFFFELFAHMR